MYSINEIIKRLEYIKDQVDDKEIKIDLSGEINNLKKIQKNLALIIKQKGRDINNDKF